MSNLYNFSSTLDTLSKTSFSFFEILNLYLWGNASGIDDKLSKSIPHMRTRSEISVEISLKSFMQECSGVINARNFQWANLFFEDKTFENITAERSKSVYSEDIYQTSLAAELHRLNPDVNPAEGYTKAAERQRCAVW